MSNAHSGPEATPDSSRPPTTIAPEQLTALLRYAAVAVGSRDEALAVASSAAKELGKGPERASRVALASLLRRRAAQHAEQRRRQGATPAALTGIRKHLESVRPSERDALLLRYVAGLPLADVAAACGAPEEEARSRLSRGLVAVCQAAEGPSSRASWTEEQSRAVSRLSEIVDGIAPDDVSDLAASDDSLRDLTHDAERLSAELSALEADFDPSLDALLMDLASPAPPAPARAGEAIHDADPDHAGSALPEHEAPPRKPAVAAKVTLPETPEQGERPLWERLGTRGRVGLALGGVLALSAFVAVLSRSGSHSAEVASAAWGGKIRQISRAFGSEGGVQRCSPEGAACTAVRDGDALPSGSTLRTDGQSRAIVDLEDGTRLSLDRGSELLLDATFPRRARLSRGALVADVPELGQSRAWIDLSRGFVESEGGRLSITADQDRALVEVARGAARLVDERERGVGIHAGESGRLEDEGPPTVAAGGFFGSTFRWSERAFSGKAEAEIVGLGELRAKKPGEGQERKGAVSLASHSTRVRIVGGFARTEIEEEFANGTDDVLEGIFRFPLPPDAQIERLALDVDGKLTEGAFVDRDRASAIWRGAIVNAGEKKPVQEEIVWVPGPWRDPALLEWQRGGRFELRIYPIPKHGSRKVILAYTEVVPPSGGTRRYVYPLPVDPSGSTRVGRFDVDVEIRGQDPKVGVRARGYELREESLPDGARHLHLSANGFVPSGDLSLEYAASGQDGAVSAWAYQPGPDETAGIPGSPVDASAPYVALAVRPRLPRSSEASPRRFAVIVDSSRSMFGERYRRAALVATRFVRELDPRDGVRVLACDSSCRELDGVRGGGEGAGRATEAFLSSITPEGGSDVTGAIRRAAATLDTRDGGGRIVYVGDGTPTIGAVSPALVRKEVEGAVPRELGTVTTVAVGADADTGTLGTLAEAGGGVLVPYAPGESAADAVYQVMGATYGDTLSEVRIDVPEGFVDLAPRRLSALTSGREVIVTGRLTRPSVEGTVVVHGRVGARPFEERYPIKIEATTAKGNAFVPRLWAAARIADLEQETMAESRTQAVALSGKFHVASRFTSLLVLESEAMFRAFGLSRDDKLAQWTGDSDASSTSSEEEGKTAEADDVGDAYETGARDKAEAPGSAVARAASGGGAPSPEPSKAAAPRAKKAYSMAADLAAPAQAEQAAPAPAPMSPPRSAATAAPPLVQRRDYVLSQDGARGPLIVEPPLVPPPPMRRMIPMRKVWERQGRIVTPATTPSGATPDAILVAQREMESGDLRRDVVKKLYTLLFASGDIERASEVAERWSTKDPLDPDALTARADVAAARGDRDLSIRILGSVVDVRPGDFKAQWRLSRLHRWAGRAELGCRHSMAIAQIRATDGKSLAEAIRCSRDLGWSSVASDLRSLASDTARASADALLGQRADDPASLSGDFRLEATWDGGDDLDLAMVHSDGRISWLGAPTRAVIGARDVESSSREALSLRGASPGDYVIEITRPRGHSGTVRGTVDISVPGERRSVPFVLDGSWTRIALVKMWMKSKLVPL